MARNRKHKPEPVYEVRDDPLKRVFPNKPGRDVIDSFLEHVRQTGKPHEWSYHLHLPPPAGAEPEILTRFEIPERLRERVLMAPCPICHPRYPKYWSGYLTWFEEDQSIRAIGADCGHVFLDDGVFSKALDRFRQANDQQQQLDFLVRNLPKVGYALSILQTLKNKADAIDVVRAGIRLSLSRTAARELHRLCGSQRVLHHFDTKRVPVIDRYGNFRLGMDGEVVMRSEPVITDSFPFYGSEALLDVRKLFRADVITAETLLDGLKTTNEDEVLDVLDRWGDANLAEPVLRLRKAWVVIQSALLQLYQLQSFLARPNIENLGAWGKSARASRNIKASYDKLGRLEIGEVGKKIRQVHVHGCIDEAVPVLVDLD